MRLIRRFRNASLGLLPGIVLVIAPGTAPAGIELGPRVRVELRDGDQRITASLLAMESDSLRLVRGDDLAQPVALADVASMEYQVGTRTYEGRGAVIGLVVGLVTGTAYGSRFEENLFHPESDEGPGAVWGQPASTALYGLAGGLVGAALGAVLGGLIETDEWAVAPIVSMVGPEVNVGLILRPHRSATPSSNY